MIIIMAWSRKFGRSHTKLKINQRGKTKKHKYSLTEKQEALSKDKYDFVMKLS